MECFFYFSECLNCSHLKFSHGVENVLRLFVGHCNVGTCIKVQQEREGKNIDLEKNGMTTMPIYGQNLYNLLRNQKFNYLDMDHQGLKFTKVI